jgi:hypothetical protein
MKPKNKPLEIHGLIEGKIELSYLGRAPYSPGDTIDLLLAGQPAVIGVNEVQIQGGYDGITDSTIKGTVVLSGPLKTINLYPKPRARKTSSK